MVDIPKLSDEDRQRSLALLDANRELIEAFAAHCGFEMKACPETGMLVNQCVANNDAIKRKRGELTALSQKLLSFGIASSVNQRTVYSRSAETYTSGFRSALHMSPSDEVPAWQRDQFRFAISPVQRDLFANMRRAMGAEATVPPGALPATGARPFPAQ